MFWKSFVSLLAPMTRRPAARPWIEPLEGRALLSAGFLAGSLARAAGGGDAQDAQDLTRAAPVASDGLDAEQKLRADQLISTFENSTTTIQYAYIANIDDGRGYTAGRAGFTTATGDFLIVVKRYTKQAPGNPLAKYLPRLRTLAKSESDSTQGLSGIVSAWRKAARSAAFRAVQDGVVDDLYYLPAVQRWQALGAQTALSLVAIYDSIIQHGEGDGHDGLPAMIGRANAAAGGTPASGIAESDWLSVFLAERYRTLSHATDPATRKGWRASRDRVTVLRQLVADGNFDFQGPLVVSVYGDSFTIP